MSVSYFKRFRMEIDLRGRSFAQFAPPPGYRLLAWRPDQLADHAEAKYFSFRYEIDADVFLLLGRFGRLLSVDERDQRPRRFPARGDVAGRLRRRRLRAGRILRHDPGHPRVEPPGRNPERRHHAAAPASRRRDRRWSPRRCRASSKSACREPIWKSPAKTNLPSASTSNSASSGPRRSTKRWNSPTHNALNAPVVGCLLLRMRQ